MTKHTSTVTLTLTQMVHGGKAMGRTDNGRVIFVHHALPNETVRVIIPTGNRATNTTFNKLIKPSPKRIPPTCPESAHCTYSHIDRTAQLRFKEAVVRDQLEQVDVKAKEIRPIIPTPPHDYRIETILSPGKDGRLGHWSSAQREIVPITGCTALHPEIRAILAKIDLNLPDLRKLTVRVGADGHLLLVFAIDEAEPPDLMLDLPVSAALVMPDGVAATLVGDPYLIQTVNDIDFRVSAGSFFHPNLNGAAVLAKTVLKMAQLNGTETVIDCFSGVGFLTHFLAEQAQSVIAIEKNPDAIEDAAVNLSETDNVSLYQDWAEDALPVVLPSADLMVIDAGEKGIAEEVGNAILTHRPRTIIYSNPEIGQMAIDAAELQAAGYKLTAIQPIDMLPQTHHVHTVALFSTQ